jgi:glycosyltransferase involved in cell wall biosynthesis
MKIAFISPWYSEGMGYTENLFPKAMAQLGADVHLVTSNAQINYFIPNYDKVYKPYLGERIVDCVVKKIDGYTLHRLPYYESGNIYTGPGIEGLEEYLKELRPDVIQTFEIGVKTTYISAKYASQNDCRFFTECHIHASVFRKDNKVTLREQAKNFVNRFNAHLNLINTTTEICYPIAKDAAEIAISHYRVPKEKIKIQSLGVDTDTFFAPVSEEAINYRKSIRQRFDFKDDDIVCIYTGRLTKDKNPHCLAEAINHLSEDYPNFKALFVGNGNDEDIAFLKSMKNCVVGPFVPAKELPRYYWSADVGVWPREESTSQLDAAACGLPLILSDRIEVLDRVDGNGFLYREGDFADLARTLVKYSDRAQRKKMAAVGIEKMNEKYAWRIIATDRLKDFNKKKSN